MPCVTPSVLAGGTFLALLLSSTLPVSAETWKGLVVAPEHRCAPYDSDDYPYPQSVELEIIESLGGRIYGPYTGRHFSNRRQTDIEHIVARSEAHDSGLCAASARTRRAFSRDLLNLTLAAPEINRCGAGGKCAHDAASWLPEQNRCWFAARIVAVRTKYRLTVDRREAQVLEGILSRCRSTALQVYAGTASTSAQGTKASAGAGVDALALWDDNLNGRITCTEARAHGIAPVRRDHPAYPFMRDADKDGVVCE